MTVVGIICEYNPFHLGHARQMRLIRERFGPDAAVVCLMSGNFVQRGEPAVFDKFARSRAAVLCGADLVLELPLTSALSSAEGFAYGGVEILHRLGIVDVLCFGSEHGQVSDLQAMAQLLLSPAFDEALQEVLPKGTSFASARAEAVERLGGRGALLRCPNDILAIEYCKALERLQSPIEPFVVQRPGDYHDAAPDGENPSATALRRLLAEGADWTAYVPEQAAAVFASAPQYALRWGERAMLARLRTLSDADFSRLPYGSEGLWNKVMRACRSAASVEEILWAAKSKRYAYSRLMRMLLCAYLGLSAEDLQRSAPYVRALAFSETGRTLLRKARDAGTIPVINAGQTPEDTAFYALERQAADLYTLFARADSDTVCGAEISGRVFYAEKS